MWFVLRKGISVETSLWGARADEAHVQPPLEGTQWGRQESPCNLWERGWQRSTQRGAELLRLPLWTLCIGNEEEGGAVPSRKPQARIRWPRMFAAAWGGVGWQWGSGTYSASQPATPLTPRDLIWLICNQRSKRPSTICKSRQRWNSF